jgi:hypothetical protein
MERRASVHVGGRTYSEVVNMAKYREYFDESDFLGIRPTWEHWTRPVKAEGDDGLNRLNGNHLLYGWIEGLFQSDRSPFFCLSERNDKAPWSYQFE